MKKNIACVTAIHGNEYLPTLALASIGVPQYIANPRAIAMHNRFIDEDMNAIFGKIGDTYERKQARKLLKQIDRKSLVLDLHTFSCESPPFAIVVDQKMISLARTLGVPYVVYMKHSIKKGHALINYRAGISVEVGMHMEKETFDQTIKVYQHATEKVSNLPSEVFEVYDIITKPGEYANFVQYTDADETFFPVLAGEKAYSFPGLKARRYNNSTQQEHI